MRTTIAFIICAALVASGVAQAQPAATASGFKIVVIRGEDAVNIIQQKTAVAPIVEVRDRNNLPVSGVAVTFSVGGQGATFGGASTLTVATNAAGQATAVGLTPTAAGALQISATATVQGQTVVATIAQSNVLTAAEVAGTTAGAGSSGAGGSGTTTATTGAAGGGGGLSGTTLGIIGGVAGGGLLVATKVAGGGDDSNWTTSTSTPPGVSTASPTAPITPTPTQGPTSSSFSGPMDGNFTGSSTVSIVGDPGLSCTFTMHHTGTAIMRLQTTATGTITGTLDMNGRQVVTTSNCAEVTGVLGDTPFVYTAVVEGSAGNVRFTQEFRDSGSDGEGSYTIVATIAFVGTVSASGVIGALTYNSLVESRGDGYTTRATWTGSIPVNLR